MSDNLAKFAAQSSEMRENPEPLTFDFSYRLALPAYLIPANAERSLSTVTDRPVLSLSWPAARWPEWQLISATQDLRKLANALPLCHIQFVGVATVYRPSGPRACVLLRHLSVDGREDRNGTYVHCVRSQSHCFQEVPGCLEPTGRDDAETLPAPPGIQPIHGAHKAV